MNVKLIYNGEDYEIVTELTTKGSFEETVQAINTIDEFIIEGVAYRKNGRIIYVVDNDCIEVYLEVSE